MKIVCKAVGLLSLLGCLLSPAAQARSFTWSGIQWDCEKGYRSPGQNYYSDSSDNIWVDANNDLHLKITYVSNRWYCAEVVSRSFFHYGDYRFQIASNVTLLDTNVVGGLFNYRHADPTPLVEIDIEFARQFLNMTTNHNTAFGVQPTPGNTGGLLTNAWYFYTPGPGETTHRFYWTNSYVLFDSYTGYGEPGSGELIAQYLRSADGPPPYPAVPAKLHMNMWLFGGRAPTDTQHLELVVHGVSAPPPEPEYVLPVVTNVLYDFENDLTNQWGVKTWWEDAGNRIFFQTSVVHSATNALRLRTDGASLYNVITNNQLSATNWSSVSKISYWAKVASLYHTEPFKVQVQFLEADLDRWAQNVPLVLSTTDWQYCEVDLVKNNDKLAGDFGFTHANNYPDEDPSAGDNTWEPEEIVEIRFVFMDPVDCYSTHNVYLDDVVLFHPGGSQTVELAVSPDPIGFGALTPDVSGHRFVSTNFAVVNYQMENLDPQAYWSIVAYTTNEERRIGVPGTQKSNLYLPLRTWVGTGTNIPPTAQTNWTTSWSFLNDQYGILLPLANPANPVPSGFKLYFAAEAMGAYTQDYSGTVTLEIRID